MGIEPISRELFDDLHRTLTASPTEADQRLDVARWLHTNAEDLGYVELETYEELEGQLEEVTGELEDVLDDLIPAPVRRLQKLIEDLNNNNQEK